MFDFEKLEVFKKAKAFHSIILLVLSKNQFDSVSRNQLSRASMSVALNIAEGASRFTNRDKRNFYIISRGSVHECIAIFDILKDQNKIDQSSFDDLYQKGEELSKMLFHMIQHLS